MPHHMFSITLVIAASLTPVTGWSASPIPVDQPDANDNADKAQSAPQAAPHRLQQLARQIAAIKEADQKRLDAQAERIDALEQQVAALTKRLRRLPQPDAKPAAIKPASTPKADADREPAPQMVSPQARNTPATASAEPEPRKDPASDLIDTAHSQDPDKHADTDTPSNDPPPTAVRVSGTNIIEACQHNRPARDQFDVFFQADGAAGLDEAKARVQSAGLSDWFASARRLYVGRYGTCPLAARRRSDVFLRTGLATNIRVVAPHGQARAKPATDQAHDYGARGNGTDELRRAAARPVQNTVTNAPFEIVGVELRGTHQYLGVGPLGATRLSRMSWLSPGETYRSWTLRSIRTDAGTATFSHDGRTVAVALPRRR